MTYKVINGQGNIIDGEARATIIDFYFAGFEKFTVDNKDVEIVEILKTDDEVVINIEVQK